MLSIPVINLLKDTEHNLAVEFVAGKGGLGKKILIPYIQKPGLALTGETSVLHTGRIQIMGKQELSHLLSLAPQKRQQIIEAITNVDVTCFVLTCGNEPPDPLKEACDAKNIPLFKTRLLTSTFINRVSRFLEDNLTASTTTHGVLMDVFGVGVLIIGKSGIGKSECALDLVLRGHRLVADDIVNIKKKAPSTLYGMGSEIIKHHLEIRGLGIINMKDLFGISAVRDRKMIELVVDLHEWDQKAEYDRLGIEEKRYTILDVSLPFIQIPVRPGRNITTIIEVAARNLLLKLGGHHSAREFQERLDKIIVGKKKEIWEIVE